MGQIDLPSPALGIAGMPGSGKSSVAVLAQSFGYTVFSMGDVVRSLARDRGIDSTPAELGRLMLSIREEQGPTVIAEKTMEKIHQSKVSRVCIEGLRSIPEVELFRRELPAFLVVAVISSPRTRFVRLTARDRRDDPKSHQIFERRDLREIGVGLGGVIALADYSIINETSMKDLKANASGVFRLVDVTVQTNR